MFGPPMRCLSVTTPLGPLRSLIGFARLKGPARNGLVVALASLSSFVGCGRPATEAECNEIVTKTATLEYEAATKSPGAVEPSQIETIRARVKDSMLRNCVGKRITEGAMRCVRNAKSAQEIQDRCFD